MVARLYPSSNPSSGRFRNFIIYAAGRGDRGGGRGGRLNGRGCGRGRVGIGGRGRGGNVQGGRGGSSSAHENGIYISDVTRYYDDSEWAALLNNTRKRITEDPVRKKFLVHQKRRTTSSAGAGKDSKNQLISQITTGVQNSSRNESGLAEGVTHFPTNGSSAQVSAANRSSTSSNINKTEERSVVIYDHLGNLVTKTLLADLFPEDILKTSVFNINAYDCQIINKVQKNQDKVIWRASATEMENHDDNLFF